MHRTFSSVIQCGTFAKQLLFPLLVVLQIHGSKSISLCENLDALTGCKLWCQVFYQMFLTKSEMEIRIPYKPFGVAKF